MKVALCISPQSHVANYVGAFGKGLEHHGHTVEIVQKGLRAYKRGELAVCWGYRTYNQIKSYFDNVIILENGHFPQDRNPNNLTWISAGWNGINGEADFVNESATSDRWETLQAAHGIDVKPWQDEGESILLLGQVPNDQSLRGIDYQNWLAAVVPQLKRNHGRPVTFRPHPKAMGLKVEGATLDQHASLDDALDACAWSVAYNSTSGVESLLRGVRHVAAHRGSMVYGVCGSHPAWIPARADRDAWLYRMAYANWSRAELQNGDAWAHLSGGIW